MPEQFDVVELIVDLPERSLYAGMQGTILDIYKGGEAYEVEFDDKGETIDFLALRPDQFILVWRHETKQPVALPERVAQLVDRLPEDARADVLDFARFLAVRAARRQPEPVV